MANTAQLSPFAKPVRFRSEILPKFPALRIPAVPLLRRGISRGGITEITGPRSSGRMSVLLHILAQATARGEICAVVDTNDQFHPASAAAAGVKLARLVWVRCRGNTEHAMRAADLLLHAGGFGVVILDLCEVNRKVLNRIPLSYWHRFRRAIEQTPTVLLVCSSSAQTKGCWHHLQLQLQHPRWEGKPPFCLLQGLDIAGRSCKPVESAVQRLSLERTA